MVRIACSLVILVALLVPALASGVPGPAPRPVAVQPVGVEDRDARVTRALEWLVRHQHPDGGFSQGEESQQMGQSSEGSLRDVPNVADTAIAALALIRAGHTPQDGRYAANVRRAVAFVCREVERSPAQGLAVTSLQGTRLQAKLGPYFDTFAAALLLAEARDLMPQGDELACVTAALQKTLQKIESNQRDDGTWSGEGWAPVLSQGMASKALNRAAQSGVEVDEKVLARAQDYASAQFDADGGRFAGAGSAGVDLYSAAGNLATMAESAKTSRDEEQRLRAVAAAPQSSAQERKQAATRLDEIQANERELAQARQAVVASWEDERFVSGFGSNGGEEFLSYLNVGEALHTAGGQDWERWFAAMVDNLARIQNQDGSWTGHHCITGRTFCTAAALMVLTIDRAERPVAERIGRRG